jgi:hypothetical protein
VQSRSSPPDVSVSGDVVPAAVVVAPVEVSGSMLVASAVAGGVVVPVLVVGPVEVVEVPPAVALSPSVPPELLSAPAVVGSIVVVALPPAPVESGPPSVVEVPPLESPHATTSKPVQIIRESSMFADSNPDRILGYT